MKSCKCACGSLDGLCSRLRCAEAPFGYLVGVAWLAFLGQRFC